MRYDLYKEGRIIMTGIELEVIAKALNINLRDVEIFSRTGNIFKSVYQIQQSKVKGVCINAQIPVELQSEWDRVVYWFRALKKSAISNS